MLLYRALFQVFHTLPFKDRRSASLLALGIEIGMLALVCVVCSGYLWVNVSVAVQQLIIM